jgi:hypothetical protein
VSKHIARLTEILLDSEMMVRVYENLLARSPTEERAKMLEQYQQTVAALKAAIEALSHDS